MSTTNGGPGGVEPEVDNVDDVPEHEGRPLRGPRISGRILAGAIVVVAIVVLVMYRGVAGLAAHHTMKSALADVSSSSQVSPMREDPSEATRDQQQEAGRKIDLGTADQAQGGGQGTPAPRRLHGNRAAHDDRRRMADVGNYDDQSGPTDDGSNDQQYQGPSQEQIAAAQRRADAQRAAQDAQAERDRMYRQALEMPSVVGANPGLRLASAGSDYPTPPPAATPAPAPSTGPHYWNAPPSAHYVRAGDTIKLALITPIRASGTANGRSGGRVWAKVIDDVLDQNGTAVLIPKKSDVGCLYKAPTAGDRELELSCDQLRRPDGYWTKLQDPDTGGGMIAGDVTGTTTLSTRVDDHKNQIVRVALGSAALSAIPIAITGTNQSVLTNPSILQQTGSNAATRINDVADRYATAQMNVPPTLYVDASAQRPVTILLHVDAPIPLDPLQESQ